MTTTQDLALLSRIRANKTLPVSLDDAAHIIRMIRDGDLIHVDCVGAWLAEQARMGVKLGGVR